MDQLAKQPAQAPSRLSTANPATETYVALHRQLENGREDDDLLRQLIGACIQLEKRDEAVRLFARVQALPVRRGLRRALAGHGWVSAEITADERADLDVTEDSEPTLGERYGDAVQHLADGQMPIVAIGGTIAFPLVLGLGGALAAIHPSLPFRMVAAIPALLLVGVVAVIGRRVLLTAMQGMQDAEPLPPFAAFRREVPIVLAQIAAAVALFFGPSILAAALGYWAGLLLLLPLGIYLLPIASALLLATNDWRVLRPDRTIAALRAGGRPYARAVVATMPLVAPAWIALLLASERPIFTALALAGPLAVAPGLAVARVFGLCLHRRAEAFAGWKLPTTTGDEFPPARWSLPHVRKEPKARREAGTKAPAAPRKAPPGPTSRRVAAPGRRAAAPPRRPPARRGASAGARASAQTKALRRRR